MLQRPQPVLGQGAEWLRATAGSLLVIMLWVFYASAILFLGASFTFSLANVSGDPVAAVNRVAAPDPQT